MNTLTNEFHMTEYRTRFSDDELDGIVVRVFTGCGTQSEKALIRKIRKALCGIEGCTCGDELGRR